MVRLSISRHGYKVTLFLIVLLGFGLRIWGIGFELPILWNSDEPILITPAVDIVRTGYLDHFPRDGHWIAYPPLFSYILAFALKILSTIYPSYPSVLPLPALAASDTYTYAPYVIGRSVSALFGTLTIFLTFLLARELFGRGAGLLSALTIAVTFLHIQYSHYVKIDVMATCFGLASVLLAWKILKTGKKYTYIGSGLLVGLTGATAFQGFLFVMPQLCASIIRVYKNWRIHQKDPIIAGILGMLAVLTGFFIGFPHLFLNFAKIYSDLFTVHGSYKGVAPILTDINQISSTRFYVEYLAMLGAYWTVLVLSLAGLRVLFKIKTREEQVFFLIFPVTYAVVLAANSYRTDRALIPLLPFLATLTGGGLADLLGRVRRIKTVEHRPFLGRIATVILLGGTYTIPTWNAVVFDYYSAQPGTGSSAVTWIQQHHRPDQLIFVDQATLSNYLQRVGFSESVVFNPYDAEMMQRVAQFSGELFIHYAPLKTIFQNYRNIANYGRFVAWYSELYKTSELVAEFGNPKIEQLFTRVRHLGPSAQAEYFHAPRIQILRPQQDRAVPFKYVYAPPSMPDSGMKRVTDSTGSYGLVMFGPKGKVSGVSGPHIPVPRGEHCVTYRLKQDATSVQSNSQTAHLFVRVSGRGSDIAGRALFTHDFTEKGYMAFHVPIHLPYAQRLEFGISTTGLTDVWVDAITLQNKGKGVPCLAEE